MTPDIFWAHREQLLAASRSQLPTLTASLVHGIKRNPDRLLPTPVAKVQGCILLCANSDLPESKHSLVWESLAGDIAYVLISSNDCNPLSTIATHWLKIDAPEGKKGQHIFLQNVLPSSMSYIHDHLSNGKRVCISCGTGRDISIGVALAALQMFFDDNGDFTPEDKPKPSRM